MKQNLDWINAMCYDYCGSWDVSVTGAHAALYDPKNISEYTTDKGLQSWIDAGIPPSKLVMGLPLYGRTWTLKDPTLQGIGAAATGIGPGDKGTMTYAEIVRFNSQHKVKEIYDQGPHILVRGLRGLGTIIYVPSLAATAVEDREAGV
ncbi:hypothetical protein C3L33_22597, partial [Rhododendron williamsianum]